MAKQYDKEFKEQVIQYVLDHPDLAYTQIAQQFGFSINGASLKPLKIQVVECHKKNNLNSRMRRNEKWQSNMTKNLRNR